MITQMGGLMMVAGRRLSTYTITRSTVTGLVPFSYLGYACPRRKRGPVDTHDHSVSGRSGARRGQSCKSTQTLHR